MDEHKRGEFEGTVLAQLAALRDLGSDIKDCLKDHEFRLKSLEAISIQAKVWVSLAVLASGIIGAKVAAIMGFKI